MTEEFFRVLTIEQMRQADAAVIASGTPGKILMENAGRAVAKLICERAKTGTAHILVGPGNNGGDGFVIARLLEKEGWAVKVKSLVKLSAFKGDAKLMAEEWRGETLDASQADFTGVDVIIDALFGVGLTRALEGRAEQLVNAANAAHALRIAVDIPSGVEGNSGRIHGSAFKADICVSFAALKPGHLLYPGRTYCGETLVADIGISPAVSKEWLPKIYWNHPFLFQGLLNPKEDMAHKYNYGHGLVVGGHKWASGASRLCADAALRIGAGLITLLAREEDCDVYAAHLTSVMLKPFTTASDIIAFFEERRASALCIGPGAGVTKDTAEIVMQALGTGKPIVLDADALTVFKENPEKLFNKIDGPVVLTPHEGEFKRLFPDLQTGSKVERAQAAAKRSQAVIILKGPDTVIAAPDGCAVINRNGSANLATAGSGDVLSGLVLGLLCRSLPAFEAACAAVWLHGEIGALAGEGLIAEDMGFYVSDALLYLSTIALPAGYDIGAR
jgi:NAD(P)H-hydrate epimerase